MTNFNIIIDNREIKLIDQLNQQHFLHTTENLDIGDIFIKKDLNPFLIIERKTIADLKSSICDGRLREQRCRLLQASGLPSSKIMYIIEGPFNDTSKRLLKSERKQIDTSTVLGSIINMMFRDNIKIHRTNSIEETADFIIKLFNKLQDKDIFPILNTIEDNETKNEIVNECPTISYTSTLHKKKKNNMTPEVWFVCQLSMIPQISDTIATVITKTYPSLSSLFLKYQSISENERPDLLTNLTYDLSTGKKRKIGKIISIRVYEFLYCTSIQNKI
jgi:ERCC4-type nuclease